MAGTTVLFQNGKLRIEMDVDGELALIRPVGVVDEDVNFSVILEVIQQLGAALKVVRFDMGHIASINSCGVREWILFMQRIGPVLKYEFANANEVFVEQANMVSNMFGKKGTPVVSFQAPYHCPKCNKDLAVVLEPNQIKIKDGVPVAPPYRCKTCSTPLEFDSFEEEYFAFIKRL